MAGAEVSIVAALARKVSPASAASGAPLLLDLRLAQSGGEALTDVTLTATAEPALFAPRTWTLARLEPGHSVEILDRALTLDAAWLASLTASENVRIRIAAQTAQGPLAAFETSIAALPQGLWGGALSQADLLAAFVAPEDPAVDAILAAAAAALAQAGRPAAFAGYATGDPRQVWDAAQALWSAVAGLGLTVDPAPERFALDGQPVRSPTALRAARAATPLEAACLLAACLERAQLNACIVLTTAKSYVGVFLQPLDFGQAAVDDPETVRRRLARDQLTLLDPTLALQTPAVSFAAAAQAGERALDGAADAEFALALDLRRARLAGVAPFGMRSDAAAAPVEAAALPFSPAPELEGFEGEPPAEATPDTAAGRLRHWQRRLLDLSTRNRLINLRANATALRLFVPDQSSLENQLHEGAKFKIRPAPPPAPNPAKDLFEPPIAVAAAQAAFERRELFALGPDRDTFEDDLVGLYRRARLDVQEGGANTLFLALGGLKWRRPGTDGRAFLAPLVLQPVALERRSARQGVELKLHEDEPRFNLTLLELLRQDFDVYARELEGPLPTDERGADIARVIDLLRTAIAGVDGLEITEGETWLATFSFAKYLMWKDLVERTDALRQNRVVRHLLDTPRQPFERQADTPAPQALDEALHPGELFAPLPADSSQLAAVVASAQGADFVLDGPPGAGKSQTIANMIAHNLALGRTVLFVAEKMAALEVVYRRLEQRGLGALCLELHSSKASKAEVLAQLKRAWETAKPPIDAEWTSATARLKETRDTLNDLKGRIHARRGNGLTLHQAIGLATRDPALPNLRLSWPDAVRDDADALARMRDAARRLAINLGQIAALDREVFVSIGAMHWSNAWRDAMVDQAGRLAAAADAVERARAGLLAHLEAPPMAADRAGLQTLRRLAGALIAAHGRDVRPALDPDAQAAFEDLPQALAALAQYRDAAAGLRAPFAPEVCRRLDVARFQREWAKAEDALWPLAVIAKRSVRQSLEAEAGLAVESDPANDLPRLAAMREALERMDRLAGASRFAAWRGVDTDVANLKASLDAASALKAALAAAAKDAAGLLAWRETARRWAVDANELLGPGSALAVASGDYRAALDAFEAALDDFSRTAVLADPPAGTDIAAFARRVAQATIAGETSLNAWTAWRRARADALDLGLKPLVAALERGEVRPGDAERAFEAAYARWFAGAEIDADPTLRSFVPAEYADHVERFRALDDAVLDLTSRFILTRAAGRAAQVEAETRHPGFGALRHQLTLQRPRKPVRQLLAEMGPALPALTPCLLMSPLSIAQYLPPDASAFDLVIFDEASQIATWDAIGAIARGRQVVIAGDPNQMPPTAFFTRGPGYAVEPEWEDDLEDDLESILDECLAAGIPRRRLTWHYRSRHETLIAFSNHRYYGGELVTFPAAAARETAVRLVRIDGAYAKGKGRVNRAEAEAMVAEAVRRLSDPAFGAQGKSLALVTLNAEQQGLVEDLLDRARGDNPDLERFFGDGPEPVVVKNLETVQGDERDVILLGVGYGPTEPGARTMSLNFGPLNRLGGWRRLNVAITRAREEMVVFASFGPEMIDPARTSAQAVHDLRRFLEFAERGPRALASRPAAPGERDASAFEEAVAAALTQRGWTVRRQFGVSRFRLDIAVVHPERADAFLAGVECEGPAFTGAATARDREKVRTQALQALGWRLVRASPAAWWIDPQKAANDLDAQLRALV